MRDGETDRKKSGDVMPHKVGWLVRGPCANSAGASASKPPQTAAGVDFFLFRRSRVLFVNFLRSVCTGLGWAVLIKCLGSFQNYLGSTCTT